MSGLGSRRKMDTLIAEGSVAVNGQVVESLGMKVDPQHDRVTVNGRVVGVTDKPVTILLNKPKDCITTLSDERGRTTVLNYVRLRQRIYPVGRLDRNTTGVLLMTNDGTLAHALMHPSSEIERVYRVTVDKPFSDEHIRQLRKGVRLEDGVARAIGAEIIDGSKRLKVLLAIGEGRNREVRRMFEELGYDVRQLDRVSYAGLTAHGLKRGAWRFLNKDEVRWLRSQAGMETLGHITSRKTPR